MTTKQPTVAVIGAGPAGLVALKNLLEEKFDAAGFDRNPYVGGLWQYTEEDKTSVLPTTVVNISKERASHSQFGKIAVSLTTRQGCFTDYPYHEGMQTVQHEQFKWARI